MNTLDCHARLAAHEDRSILPFECKIETPGGVGDLWPAAAVAGIILTGWLSQLETDAELDEALAQFIRLLDGGMVTQQQWEREIEGVVGTLMVAGEERDHLMAEA